MCLSSPAIGQFLSEEDIVVRVNWRETVFALFGLSFFRDDFKPVALIYRLRYLTGSIAEVTILEAVFDVPGIRGFGSRSCRTVYGIIVEFIVLIHVEYGLIVLANGEVVVGHTRGQSLLVAVALVEIEVVEVVSQFAAIEGCVRLGRSLTTFATRGDGLLVIKDSKIITFNVIIKALIAIPEVGVDKLITLRVGRVTEYSVRLGFQGRCCSSLRPTTLHITFTRVHDTSSIECTHYTEVVYLTTKVVEQRVVETTNGMTITMQNAIEAMSCISADWCPTLRMINICAHEELQVLTATHLRGVQRRMSF